jgi:competence protein ComFC
MGVSVLTEWLKQLPNEVIEIIFPRECLGCGRRVDFICTDCARKLPRLNPPICQRCGKPESSGKICPDCWGKQVSADNIRSVFIFEGIVRSAIHQFKYRQLKAISVCLSQFMADYYRENKLSGYILVPVPLHEKRLKERGYNQSDLLANGISNLLSIPVDTKILHRIKESKPQAKSRNVKERRDNTDRAFKCNSASLNGMDIIVIDDVCTSGATIEACAFALKNAGANRVTGFTLAREI